MSDMAVNTTGVKNVDSIQTGELCKEAMIFSKDVISPDGFFISKIFMGSSFNEIVCRTSHYQLLLLQHPFVSNFPTLQQRYLRLIDKVLSNQCH